MKIVIGSRGSKLAVAQAEWIAAELRRAHPAIDIAMVTITTTGDRDARSSLKSIGGKGVFVKEIEEALQERAIDLAVHSLKDVPAAVAPGLCLGPFPKREDPRDAAIARFGEQLRELPRGSIVATSSPRRQAQIRKNFPNRYRIEEVRGNVDTRLRKLKEGRFDMLVMALAGLRRLNLESEVTEILDPHVMLPAPGQGCLALELRENDERMSALLGPLRDDAADRSARAERAFLAGVGGDCLVPLGCHTVVTGPKIHMEAAVWSPDGQTEVRVREESDSEPPELIGAKLAGRLLHDGGSEILCASQSHEKKR